MRVFIFETYAYNYYSRPASPAGYEYYGYHFYSSFQGCSGIREQRPVVENSLWRNFAASATDFTNANFMAGVYGDLDEPDYYDRVLENVYNVTNEYGYVNPPYLYNPDWYSLGSQPNPLPLYVSTADFPWYDINEFVRMPYSDADGYAPFTLPSGAKNVYGLPINAIAAAGAGITGADPYAFVTPPLSLPLNGIVGTRTFWFQNTAQPDLTTVGYYFASQTPFFNSGSPTNFPPPVPGSPTFSPTNASPPLIVGYGNRIVVSGWARQSINNGYAGKYAFLEQYFDKALKMDANGNTTTNQTGILSPYGEFTPSEPGQAALVTMPDIDTGQRGTNLVYVIKLILDANHDGVMDLSFTGLDNTSVNRPMVFWLNNDYDRKDSSGTNQDDFVTASNPSPLSSLVGGTPMADCNYTNLSGQRAIPCTRDLEDYTRLWVAGVTSNLLAVLPSGSTITLSWGDVGSPDTNNPTIDLFTAADSDGGMGYLTNATIAAQQTDPASSPFIGRLGPGQTIQLNASTFANHWAGNYFIWCGVNNGTGGLTLTIADGNSNILAQTTAYVQIKDIKQMYERWTIGDAPNIAPKTTAVLAQEQVSQPFQYGPPADTNTPYILFVHGWNMKLFEKDRWAETAYKRLYWQGYQGRFGIFRWPTGNGFSSVISVLTDANNYDNSENVAWQSGQALESLLSALNTEYPDNVFVLAHSMGNVVTGEALRLAGTSTLVNTYVASQAAISARAYDNTLPADATNSYTPHVYTPDSEGHYYGSNSPPYFNGIGGALHFVDYYNVEDFALSYWITDQNFKADSFSYHYATPSSQFPSGYYYEPPFTIAQSLVFPTNTYVIFSQAAQSYSLALGAETNIAATFSTLSKINLDVPPFSFGRLHVGHSLQFRNDNMTSAPYWHQLLVSFGIQQQ